MMEDTRLKNVFNSASNLFINQGFSDTKMKDIAQKAGISVGSLYDLFQNKDTLLQFIFEVTLDSNVLTSAHQFPIEMKSTTNLMEQTSSTYEIISEKITHNLLQNESYTLSEFVNDLFTVFEKYGQYFLILESNPDINSDLTKLYKTYRENLYHNLAIYLSKELQNKHLRQNVQPQNDAMIIIDLVFWWSTHKKYDSFESAKNNYSLVSMQKSISNLLSNGYNLEN